MERKRRGERRSGKRKRETEKKRRGGMDRQASGGCLPPGLVMVSDSTAEKLDN